MNHTHVPQSFILYASAITLLCSTLRKPASTYHVHWSMTSSTISPELQRPSLSSYIRSLLDCRMYACMHACVYAIPIAVLLFKKKERACLIFLTRTQSATKQQQHAPAASQTFLCPQHSLYGMYVCMCFILSIISQTIFRPLKLRFERASSEQNQISSRRQTG